MTQSRHARLTSAAVQIDWDFSTDGNCRICDPCRSRPSTAARGHSGRMSAEYKPAGRQIINRGRWWTVIDRWRSVVGRTVGVIVIVKHKTGRIAAYCPSIAAVDVTPVAITVTAVAIAPVPI